MTRLFKYYETELDYMRRAFTEFEAKHPQTAKTLGVNAGKSSDPDIQRLSDSLALIAARMTMRMDDTVPEMALDLTRIISPAFLLGAPSYCPVQVSSSASALRELSVIKKGQEISFSQAGEGASCRYMAAADSTIAPISVSNVKLETSPLAFETPQTLQDVEAALTFTVSTWDAKSSLQALDMDRLPFYVCAPAGRKKRLINLLAGEVLAIGIGTEGQKATHWLKKESLQLSLLNKDYTYLPSTQSGATGFDRLRNFLAYPDQGAYFELSGLKEALSKLPTGRVSLRLFIGGLAAKNLGDVASGDLAGNVIPLVNCYQDKSQPVRYDFARSQVPLKPVSASKMEAVTLQVSGIDMLTPTGAVALPAMTTPERRRNDRGPVWQERHFPKEFDHSRKWVSFSVPELKGEGESAQLEPLDLVASLVCSNGSAATTVRPGTESSFEHKDLSKIPFYILSEPSLPVFPEDNPEQHWNALSLINANFASIFEVEDPVKALKEALHLCAPTDFCMAANAIWAVNMSRSVAPVRVNGASLLTAGSSIEIILDLASLPFSAQVFAVVLHSFLGSFVSYDRFYQLSVRERGKDDPFCVFPRVHGGTVGG
ncbi:type VI secretion system baseplate subunit TssF [Flexibacterium corallicola]|uniref:type VI secretion system baseplate subunit TssF n=1 Tax=Flexibacterium corallicola TaxID=3037259 RepID=UPI00286F177D|nr:type VI secretion system baseplate subunit TssF [Pseudovibrio sp. M1P-2-3]